MILNKIEVSAPEMDVPSITETNVAEEKALEGVEKPKVTRKPRRKKETKPVVENNEQNVENMNENIEKIKKIVGQDVEIPERQVKIEKKDKGLIERTENSAILITEDNKMILND
jgi:hypothetical protein